MYHMVQLVDEFLNEITMYRLVLYYLIALLVIAFVFSFFGIISYSPLSIVLSSLFLVAVCYVTNLIFAKVFEAPTNVESVYITALILALILSPAPGIHEAVFLFWAGVWAMASKYMFSFNHKHIFNPAAFGVALIAYTLNQSATWWVGTYSMLPFVILGGLLVGRKLRRFDLIISFVAVVLIAVLGYGFIRNVDFYSNLKRTLVDTPLFFLAFVMLTEPLSTPPTRLLRISYGSLVGLLMVPQLHIGTIYSTPELALLLGNIYSYIVSPKYRLTLHLKEKVQAAAGIFDFVFATNRKIAFQPGQYMEWTLWHPHADSRGNRRYFTIASSPTEENLMLGVRFYEPPSSYKKQLKTLAVGDTVSASQLAGDFTMPKDQSKKLVFIAGGIGITPFRSMVKYLTDTNQKRDIVLFYSNRTEDEIVYANVFAEAEKKLGIRIVYVLSDKEHMPSGWKGETGHVDAAMIEKIVPDYKERLFYISGSNAMVKAFEKTLSEMGISKNHIVVDYFPGFA